jgi:hypothetical protein
MCPWKPQGINFNLENFPVWRWHPLPLLAASFLSRGGAGRAVQRSWGVGEAKDTLTGRSLLSL